MKTTIEVDLKWYYLSQNNSGGWFYRNENVREFVLVQATSPEDAEIRANSIISGYTHFCDCCGERWDTSFDETDGRDEPHLYSKPLADIEAGYFYRDAVLYHYDGTRRYYKFGVGFVPYEQLEDDE